MGRRRSRYVVPGPRAGSVLLAGGRSGPRRRRGGARRPIGGGSRAHRGAWLLGVLVVVAAVVGGLLVWRSVASGDGGRRAAAERFLTGWTRRDWAVMWQALTPSARVAYPEARFAAAYRSADRAAGVRWVRVGKLGGDHDGGSRWRYRWGRQSSGRFAARSYCACRGPGMTLAFRGTRRCGCRVCVATSRCTRGPGPQPRRGAILAADGTPLDATALGASIAGQTVPEPSGLERIYDRRLSGRPSAELLFGSRAIARAAMIAGRSLPTTISPRLMTVAAAALGQRLGGVAVIQPRDGAVEALAGLAVSAPQPPGSTFKIITVSAALQHGIATPSSTYPIRTSATLSGVELRNAGGEACGGSLTEAFAVSCNSVFAPLGAKLGARRLVDMARAFGFDQSPTFPTPSQARSRRRPSCATTSPSGPPRSARTATSRRRSRWPASAPRSLSTAIACDPESRRSNPSSQSRSSQPRSPTRSVR